jgi:hypothetical protein
VQATHSVLRLLIQRERPEWLPGQVLPPRLNRENFTRELGRPAPAWPDFHSGTPKRSTHCLAVHTEVLTDASQ